MRHNLLRHLEFTKLTGKGQFQTQHVNSRAANVLQMLRKTGLVVRATEEKTYFDESCYTNRSVKLVINKGEIINYNKIYIQHVTKSVINEIPERKEKEYTITSK